MKNLMGFLVAIALAGCGGQAVGEPETAADTRSMLMERAAASERQGEALQAEQYWLAAWEQGEDIDVVLPPLLASCIRGGRLESALRHVERAGRLRPNDPAFLHLQAELLRALGRAEQAFELLYARSEQVSLLPETVFLLGTLESSRGDEDAARQHWAKYLELAPEGPRASQARALIGGAS